ncbi:MAG: hypothetical protein J0H77_08500, partial [Alphaproteobacteria bacterium]|nr:hypothetical protein [Alphaproteobacteria bacterium]
MRPVAMITSLPFIEIAPKLSLKIHGGKYRHNRCKNIPSGLRLNSRPFHTRGGYQDMMKLSTCILVLLTGPIAAHAQTGGHEGTWANDHGSQLVVASVGANGSVSGTYAN